MKHLNFLSNLLSLSLGSPCTDVSLDCRLTVGSPSGRYSSGLMRLVFILAILLTVGVGTAWGTTPTTEDLDFGTPAVNTNFDNIATVTLENKTASAASGTSLSTFGPFTHYYLGKNANGTQSFAIEDGDDTPFDSRFLSMTSTNNVASISFARATDVTRGAFSFKIAKTSKALIGLYNGDASGTALSHASAAVYLQFNGSKIALSSGTSGTGWQDVITTLPSTNILEVTVIYNNTSSATTYGGSISLAKWTAHVYVNGSAVMNGENPKALTISNNGGAGGSTRIAANNFRIAYSSAGTAKIDEIKIYSALPTAAVSCSNTVTLSKGSESNGTLTLGSTSITTCNATASTRQVTITVAPSTGYAAPSTLSWTKSSGTVTATKISGPTGSSSPYSYVYQFDQDDSGAGTFGVTCTAKSYTVTLNDGDGSGGDGSVTVTYNANTNLTSAVTVPTRTGYDFNGYRTSALTTLIDEDGNWLASKTGYTDASKNWIYADDVTLNAYWTVKNYSVTWKVNNTAYTDGSPSDNVNHGSRVSKLPTDPDPGDYCGDKFIGWTDATDGAYVHGTSTLFTTAGTAPVASGAQVYYAVFADYTTE